MNGNVFLITLECVAVMLLYAFPGYVLVKKKMIVREAIPAFAKVLVYVCSPCLTVYTFQKVKFSWEAVKEMGSFFLITLFLQGAMMALFYFIFRKKSADIRYRVCAVGICSSNCSFMGIPLLETLLPGYSAAAMMSTMFFLTMNVLGWTATCAIIAGDIRYMKLKNIILNPAMLALFVALPLFALDIQLPAQLGDMVTLLGRMSTPMAMLIMGMRLATVPWKPLLTDKLQYLTAAVKLFIIPLMVLAFTKLLPFSLEFRQTLYIMCCCPVASGVLNFAELIGQGQDTSANIILLSTAMSVITIPIMMLLA